MPDKVLLDFLEKDPVCVLSIAINSEAIHGAAMHYSYSRDPIRLFFSADKSQRKLSGLSDSTARPASVVVGISEQTWVTCQMSGQIRIVTGSALKEAKDRHYERIPSAKQFENDPGSVFLVFEPDWYRLTDFNSDTPKIMTQS